MKRVRKTVSVLLALLFLFQAAAVSVVAQGDVTQQNESSLESQTAATEPVEDTSLRDEYTKHFRTPDGKYYASVSEQPVHYRKDGKWEDVDLTLRETDEKTGYAVSDSKAPVYIPKKLTDGERITVTFDGHTVGFAPDAQNAGFNAKSTARVSAKQTDSAKYANVLSGVDLEYKTLPNGVKENIVIKSRQNAYHFVFDLDLDGLLPVKQKDGSVYLFESEEDDEPVMVMDMPFMVDADGTYSDAVTLSLSGNRLTVTANADWINAEDRAFPVTVDPYLYVPSSSYYLHTGYVTNLHPNQNSVGEVSTGRNGLYADRTYFKFDFPNVPPGCTFHSASLILYQILGLLPENTTNYLRLYDLSEYNSWSHNAITWNHQPVNGTFNAYSGTPYIGQCALSTAVNTVYTFSLTKVARAFYAGVTNNGYLLAMADETSGAFSWCGELGGSWGTPPELRVYYTRPCSCCGDRCVFDTSGGESCPCTCSSWETCTCRECGYYCKCKATCAYGLNCGCSCLNPANCTCVACIGITDTTKDLNDNITSYSLTDGTKTMTESYTYNTDNALTQMVDANGNSLYYTYGANSEQPSSITMGSSTVNYTYNADDLLTNVSQTVTGLPSGSTIANAYTYDTDQNVTSISHNGFAYNFTYDANGNNTAVRIGNTLLAGYTYNADGNLTQIAYGSNNDHMTYYYDSDGRVTAIATYGSALYDGPNEFLLSYDEDGNLETIWDTAGYAITYYYDYGYETYRFGTNELLFSVVYDEEIIHSSMYDVTSIDGEIGGIRVYTEQEPDFDFVTGETTYRELIETDVCDLTAEMVYDYFGRKTGSTTESTVYGSNAATTLTEEVTYNDTSTTAGTLPTHYESTVSAGNTDTTVAFRYTYDNRGNITAVYDTTTVPETLTARYAYDETGQLVREDNAQTGDTVTYVYDQGGNIVSKTIYPFTTGTPGTATDTVTYTYDSAWKDQLASYDGELLDCDELGNPEVYTLGRNFEWVGRELVCAYFDDADTYIEYRYNENGLRNVKRIYDDDHLNDPLLYRYFWSDDNRLLGYVYDQPEANADDYTVLVLYNSAKEPIGFTVSSDLVSETYYYLKNIQGDVLCVTDDAGTPLVNYTYDAWGAFTLSPASQQVSSSDLMYISALNPVTYRGYQFDVELGLYYLQSRFYDPETGRFLSVDVTCDSGDSIISPNSFTYAENSPTIAQCEEGEKTHKYSFFGFGKNEIDFKTPWEAEIDAPQSIFGYCDLYDTLAKESLGFFSLNYLVSEFEYDSKKWRVEFWKGRYAFAGIGAEIGFYNKTNNFLCQILPYRSSLDTLFEMSFQLYSFYGGENLICERKEDAHWWLAGIVINPIWVLHGKAKQLSMTAKIKFIDSDMAQEFVGKIDRNKTDGFFLDDGSANNSEYVRIKWAEQYNDMLKLNYLT